MAKATIERELHLRKKQCKIVVYSKFMNLGRKNRKFKKGKIAVLEVKTVKYNNLKSNWIERIK